MKKYRFLVCPLFKSRVRAMSALELLLAYSILLEFVCEETWVWKGYYAILHHVTSSTHITHKHLTQLLVCLCAHVFVCWRASWARTSAELINNNLDKLSLSDHSACPHNHTTEEAVTGWARDMTDSSLDHWKALLDQSPTARGEDTMIHGQRATWTEWLGKLATPPTNTSMPFTGTPADLMKRWTSAREYLVQLDKDAKPGNYESNSVWDHDDDDVLSASNCHLSWIQYKTHD